MSAIANDANPVYFIPMVPADFPPEPDAPPPSHPEPPAPLWHGFVSFMKWTGDISQKRVTLAVAAIGFAIFSLPAAMPFIAATLADWLTLLAIKVIKCYDVKLPKFIEKNAWDLKDKYRYLLIITLIVATALSFFLMVLGFALGFAAGVYSTFITDFNDRKKTNPEFTGPLYA